MQSTAGEAARFEPNSRDEAYRSVVSDLIGLIEHVRTSVRLIEREIARESSLGSQEAVANVIVLDDVSPRYVAATAALKACDTNLRIALHALQDSTPPKHGAGAHAGMM